MSAPARPLKFWAAGGSILTSYRDEDGRAAVVFVEDCEIPDLERWYADAPLSDEALDLRRAIDARDEYRAVVRCA